MGHKAGRRRHVAVMTNGMKMEDETLALVTPPEDEDAYWDWILFRNEEGPNETPTMVGSY